MIVNFVANETLINMNIIYDDGYQKNCNINV